MNVHWFPRNFPRRILEHILQFELAKPDIWLAQEGTRDKRLLADALQIRLVKLHLIAPAAFCMVHGDVGTLDQQLLIAAVIGIDGDPQACRPLNIERQK